MSSGSKAGPAKAPMPSAGSPARCAGSPGERRVIEVGPEHRLRRRQQFGRQRRLPPAHHLRIEPGGLHRIGPAGALAADQQIAIARRARCRRARPSGGRRACGGSPRRRRRCGSAPRACAATSSRLARPRRNRRRGHARAPAARSASGFSSAQRARTASTFSAARGRISETKCRMKPMPRSTATEFHGAPTQKRVDMPVGEALHHVGRRQHHEPHVLVRDRRRPPPSRSAGDNCGSRTGTSCRR